MTWPVTLGLSAVLLIATPSLRSELPTLVICKDWTALAPAEEVSEIQEGHGPIRAPAFRTMAAEDASSPYEYRERSRNLGRDRKLGRSRDERGESSQQAQIRGGVLPQYNSIESAQGELAGVNQKERSLEESEEGL